MTDTLPTGATFVSATSTLGTCTHVAGVVTCTLGNFANQSSATITIQVTAPLVTGPITNNVAISSNEPDNDSPDNSFNLVGQVFVPPLSVTKVSQANFDPFNLATNPKLITGGVVAYTIRVGNPNAYTVTSNSIVVTDSTPANLSLFVDAFGGGPGPVRFEDGNPATGLSFLFTSLASQTDDVEFSNDNAATWSYTPVANSAGLDPAVTHIRIRPRGTMAPGTNFVLRFAFGIR